MQVFELAEGDKGDWDRYVLGSAQATAFHLAGWRDVMEGVYGLKSHFLLAKDGDQISGVLPLLHVRSRLSGNFLTSMPGAICAEDEMSAQALIERAVELVTASRAKYLILRDGRQRWDLPGLVTNEDHVTFVVELAPDPEQVRNGFKKRTRQLVNSAVRNGLEVSIGTEYLERFYPVYTRAMRELGTPTPGLDFFHSVVTELPTTTNLLTISYDKQVVGGGFLAPFRDTIYCTWAGLLRDFYEHRPSHLLVWETIRYGCQNGFLRMDMGRCRKESGGYVFKKDFGGEAVPLYQQFYLNGITRPPAVGGSMEEDPRYRLFVKAWRSLPLPVTEVLGPQLRRRMPFG